MEVKKTTDKVFSSVLVELKVNKSSHQLKLKEIFFIPISLTKTSQYLSVAIVMEQLVKNWA